MSQCKVKINERDSAKKQALEIIKELEKVISIKRAQMRVLASFCTKELMLRFKTEMQENFENDYTIEEIKGEEALKDQAGEEIKTQSEVFTIQMAIEPHLFRSINDQIFGKTKKEKQQWNECHMEVRDQCIKLQVDEGEIIQELDQNDNQPLPD